MSERWWSEDALPTKTRLPSGGWYPPFFKTGHYEVTGDVAESFGFSSAAVAILRDASQDPDFYAWNVPAAHAQSPDDADEPGLSDDLRAERRTSAIDDFKRWAADCVDRTERALSSDGGIEPEREALYWIGYLLHGVEDLAPHAGRTNLEHAANDPNPDLDESAVQLAHAYAYRMLRAVRTRLGAAAFDRLRRWDGEGTLARSEKVELHGHGWDLTFAALAAYRAAGKNWKAPGTRWPRERVLAELVEKIAPAGSRRVDRPRRTSVMDGKHAEGAGAVNEAQQELKLGLYSLLGTIARRSTGTEVRTIAELGADLADSTGLPADVCQAATQELATWLGSRPQFEAPWGTLAVHAGTIKIQTRACEVPTADRAQADVVQVPDGAEDAR